MSALLLFILWMDLVLSVAVSRLLFSGHSLCSILSSFYGSDTMQALSNCLFSLVLFGVYIYYLTTPWSVACLR